MSFEPAELERLRAALRSKDGATSSECPDPARIWEGATGRLQRDQVGALLRHCIRCPECQQAWELAREFAAESGMSAAPIDGTEGNPSRRRWRLIAFAAAAAAVAAGLPMVLRNSAPPSPEPGFRSELAASIRSESAEKLPRDHFLLRWSASGEGTRCSLSIARADLSPVHVASDLAAPAYLVPAAALADLPSGTKLVWRIQARAADGSLTDSPAFLVELQ